MCTKQKNKKPKNAVEPVPVLVLVPFPLPFHVGYEMFLDKMRDWEKEWEIARKNERDWESSVFGNFFNMFFWEKF